LSSQAKETWWTPQVQDSKHSGTNPTANGERDLLVNQVNWATPNTMDYMEPRPAEAMKRMLDHGQRKNRKWSSNVREQVVWDQNYAPAWATPNARDPKGAQGRMAKLGQMSDLPSQTEVAPTGQWNRANGKLNPAWVTCLMGLDLGWVDPLCPASVIKNWPRFVSGWVRPQTAPILCDSSAMELSRPPQSEPSEFSLAS